MIYPGMFGSEITFTYFEQNNDKSLLHFPLTYPKIPEGKNFEPMNIGNGGHSLDNRKIEYFCNVCC